MARLIRHTAIILLLAGTAMAPGSAWAQSSGSGGASSGASAGGMSGGGMSGGGMSGGSSASTGTGVTTPSSSHPEILPSQSPANSLHGTKGIKPVDQASTVDKRLEQSNDSSINSICGSACGVNQQPATP